MKRETGSVGGAGGGQAPIRRTESVSGATAVHFGASARGLRSSSTIQLSKRTNIAEVFNVVMMHLHLRLLYLPPSNRTHAQVLLPRPGPVLAPAQAPAVPGSRWPGERLPGPGWSSPESA